MRDRLFYFGPYSPRFSRRTNSILYSSGTEPGEIERKQTATQAFGKVTYSGRRITASGSALYTPTTSEGTLPAYDGLGPNYLGSTAAANTVNLERGFEQTQTNTTGNVDIVLGNNAYASVRGGYFYDNYKDTGIPNTTNYIYHRIPRPPLPLPPLPLPPLPLPPWPPPPP